MTIKDVSFFRRLKGPLQIAITAFRSDPSRRANLLNLVAVMTYFWRLKKFKLVEVGVFKADNAVSLISAAKRNVADVSYVGFDLFDEAVEFYQQECWSEWMLFQAVEQNPYWEFQSGSHKFKIVEDKIAAILPHDAFHLIQGDSRKSLSGNRAFLSDADLIYIDGCHDYEFVSSDWSEIKESFENNWNLVVAFDDLTNEGVGRVKNEIDKMGRFKTILLNYNQFLVISYRMDAYRRNVLRFATTVWNRGKRTLEPWPTNS